MYKDLINAEFDYILFGTSLTESTLSAYLSKLGKKTLVIDVASSYGGDCKNFNLREMEKFIQNLQESTCSDPILKQYRLINRSYPTEDITKTDDFRNYNFDMNPKFIYAQSKSTEELSNSNASSYIEFSSVKHIYFYYEGKLLSVPFSKSEIFTSNHLDLIEKQKLLAFLYAIMKIKNTEKDVNSTTDIKKDYEVDNAIISTLQSNLNAKATVFLKEHFSPKVQAMITLILGNIEPNSQNDAMTVDELITRIYKFILSLQIYDNTPFLYPCYGSSEFTQALCRLSAVHNGIFLVNESLKVKITVNQGEGCRYVINLIDEERKENFNMRTNNVVINEVLLNNDLTSISVSPEVVKYKSEGKKLMKYIYFASIKNVTVLRESNNGIVYYKIMKEDSVLKNCYGFTSIEYFHSSNAAPRNRSLIYISIINDKDDNDNEEVFVEKCKGIIENYIKRRLEDISDEIKMNYNKEKGTEDLEQKLRNIEIIEENATINEILPQETVIEQSKLITDNSSSIKESNNNTIQQDDKKDEESKPIELSKQIQPSKDKMSLTSSILLQYEFLQVIPNITYEYIQPEDKLSNLFITKNNYVDIDLDYYYIECESIVKQSESITKLSQDPPKEEQRHNSCASDDIDLIDQLFNSITLEEKQKDESIKEKINEIPSDSK